MKTILEYLQKGHIKSILKMDVIDGIHCFNIGKHNGKNVYISLPSIDARELKTDPSEQPISAQWDYHDVNMPEGWYLPSKNYVETVLTPLINVLNDYDVEQIFGACSEPKVFTFYGIFRCAGNGFGLKDYFSYIGRDSKIYSPGISLDITDNINMKYYIVACKEI